MKVSILGRPRSPFAPVLGATLWCWLVLQSQLPRHHGLLEPGPRHLRGKDKGAGCEVTSGRGRYLTRGHKLPSATGQSLEHPCNAEGTLTTGPDLILWRKYWARSKRCPGREAVSRPCSQILRGFPRGTGPGSPLTGRTFPFSFNVSLLSNTGLWGRKTS